MDFSPRSRVEYQQLDLIQFDSVGFNMIQLDSIGFNWIQLDSIGFIWIQLDSIGFNPFVIIRIYILS